MSTERLMNERAHKFLAMQAALTTAFNLLSNTDWWGRQEQPPPEHAELWRQIQELQEMGIEIG